LTTYTHTNGYILFIKKLRNYANETIYYQQGFRELSRKDRSRLIFGKGTQAQI